MFIAQSPKPTLAPLGATCHIALLTERNNLLTLAINMWLLWSHHSYLSATSGSIRVARRTGR
jgi:hypothetical protein